MLTSEEFDKWITALRNTPVERRFTGSLCSPDGRKVCAMGLLAETLGVPKVERADGVIRFVHPRTRYAESEPGVDKFWDVYTNIEASDQVVLKNDAGWDWLGLADYIESVRENFVAIAVDDGVEFR